MEMKDRYRYDQLADLRQYINGRTGLFMPPADLITTGYQNQHLVEMLMTGDVTAQPPPHHHPFHESDSATTGTFPANLTGRLGLDMDMMSGGFSGDGGTGRWPRQETLTLLQIRSRLDSKFKEANQKGPLWDQVSRILSEEHGYQRSGKKCREKFDNLYKYYKKTKEGKAGRQDGKHYRFFRQLEALYGETRNNIPALVSETHHAGTRFQYINAASNNCPMPNQETFDQPPQLSDSLSPSNTSLFESSSSEGSGLNADEKRKNKRRRRRSWKAKIRDFIDAQMRKLMEKQEEWLEKMMMTIEHKEQERMIREEEWGKQEAARINREHAFWAKERAWIEARDASLMEALHKLTGKESKISSPEGIIVRTGLQNVSENQNDNGSETITHSVVNAADSWPEYEITRLIQLRTGLDSRFQQSGCQNQEVMLEEIGSKMGSLGYDRSGPMCKEKWDSINNYLMQPKECSKKRKENFISTSFYFQNKKSIGNQDGAYLESSEGGLDIKRLQTQKDHIASPPNANANGGNGSSFRFFMANADNLWQNYGLRLSKGDSH